MSPVVVYDINILLSNKGKTMSEQKAFLEKVYIKDLR